MKVKFRSVLSVKQPKTVSLFQDLIVFFPFTTNIISNISSNYLRISIIQKQMTNCLLL